MIHELLLSLSGHPSPLLSYSSKTNLDDSFLHSLLSPAELALLKSLAVNLGDRHKDIRESAGKISETHPSTVCRAVSNAIVSTHLAQFQDKILEVEKGILQKSPSIVGAYNAVSLSAIVGAFDGWVRRLEWLWHLVQHIQSPYPPEPDLGRQDSCTAADVIKYLRDATHTGYPDIEKMALDLAKVAEMAWLKQVSAWVLYGRHPGAADFFITRGEPKSSGNAFSSSYSIVKNLIPCFVTSFTANSILFIGKSLNHIRDRQTSVTGTYSKTDAPELALLPTHLAYLSNLQSPISPASFTAAIGAIRLSLSQNALQKLLPMSKVLEILHILRDFFLLERGEFAVALVDAADDRLSSTYPRDGKAAQKSIIDLANMTIKEGEVHTVLAKTWATLESLRGIDEEDVDEVLDRAGELIRLSIKSTDTGSQLSRDTQQRASMTTFDDLLLPSSTTLSLHVPSPLDLFLTPLDTEMYSRIHSYLLAIRRAHLRLSKLFLLSVLRRDHPSPRKFTSDHPKALGGLLVARQKASRRTRVMRPIWATIGSAAFFLTELGEYFHGEVIPSSWGAFHSWLVPTIAPGTHWNDSNLSSTSLRPASSHLNSRPNSSRGSDEETSYGLHDPESLAEAHRAYLTSLEGALLLTNENFTKLLRRHMTAIDHLAALMRRLDTVQQSLDAETDAGDAGVVTNYANEEQSIVSELQLARIKVAAGVQGLIDALRNAGSTKAGSHIAYTDTESVVHGFTPWSGGAIDRLLLKFDYGNIDGLAAGG